jgi:hypothetical protein
MMLKAIEIKTIFNLFAKSDVLPSGNIISA